MNKEMLANEVVMEVISRGYDARVISPEMNSRGKWGISIMKKGAVNNIAPVMYIHDRMTENDIDEFVNEMIEFVNNDEGLPNVDVNMLSEWDKVKEMIVPCVAPKRVNDDILYGNYLNLHVYFRIILKGSGEVVITKKLADSYGKDAGDLYDQAMQNVDYGIKSMGSTLNELLTGGEDLCPNYKEMEFPAVATSKEKRYGAAAIMDTDLLRTFADAVGKDLYILPSSIHEILILPEGGAMNDPNELLDLVKDVNASEVMPEDFLADAVYKFSRNTGLVSICAQ